MKTPALALVFLMLAGAGVAHAGTATATLAVSVRVLESCDVNTSPLTLAPYVADGTKASGTQTAGQILLRCSRGTAATIALDPGPLIGPTGATLRYTLTAAPSAIGRGREVLALPVQGSVPAGQRVPPGAYAGEALVRVSY